MSDFTKDELKSLAYGLECSGIPNSDLRKKVLSMIDNHCDHDENGGEVEVIVDTCSKCNAFILRQSHYE